MRRCLLFHLEVLMRGIYSLVTDIRKGVFTEVAKLAYEGGDMKRVDLIP